VGAGRVLHFWTSLEFNLWSCAVGDGDGVERGVESGGRGSLIGGGMARGGGGTGSEEEGGGGGHGSRGKVRCGVVDVKSICVWRRRDGKNRGGGVERRGEEEMHDQVAPTIKLNSTKSERL